MPWLDDVLFYLPEAFQGYQLTLDQFLSAGGWVMQIIALLCLLLFSLLVERYWYRYHHLFADVLKARLKNSSISTTLLHTQASGWFAEQQLFHEAIEHALQGENFEKVIFNTASSNKEVIALTRFLPKKIKCYGIIHNLRKLNQSASQRTISKRITDYYVLNDFLIDSATLKNKKIKLHSFYPIFFPEYTTPETIKKISEFWVCIPGELNYKRRDYTIILEALSKLEEMNNLKIILLGKMDLEKTDTKSFLSQVKEMGLENYFMTFDCFIDNSVFHEYIKKSDYIMAPVSLGEQNYLEYKITGAYNLAFAYKKPLICPEELSIIPDLNATSHFYKNAGVLSQLLKNINSGTLSRKKIYDDSKWNFETQQEKYLKLLET